MLSTVVLYSFAYLLLLSTSLFLFIFLRRLVIESRERRDLAAYTAMERDLLEVLTAADVQAAAVAFAASHRGRPRAAARANPTLATPNTIFTNLRSSSPATASRRTESGS